MSLVHRLASVVLVLGVVLPSFASCAAPVAGDDGAPSASTDQALRGGGSQAGCPVSTTYYVVEPTEAGVAPACATVSGRRGEWDYTGGSTIQPCFSKADASVTSFLCAYAWTSPTGAAPDVAALSALPGISLAPRGGGDGSNCADSSPLPYVALLDDAAVTCPPVPGGPGINGPKGCEVCGTGLGPGVIGNHLYLSSSTTLHTVAVSLSNGTKEIVTLGDLHARGRFVEVALPPLPRGVDYEEGPALGYSYDPTAH